jgi:hypothetical protein
MVQRFSACPCPSFSSVARALAVSSLDLNQITLAGKRRLAVGRLMVLPLSTGL